MINFVIASLVKLSALAVPVSLVVMALGLDYQLLGLVLLGLIWLNQLVVSMHRFRQLRFELTGADDLVRNFVMDSSEGIELSNKLVREDPNESPRDRWFNLHQFGCACARLGAEAAITQERERLAK